MTYPHTIQMVDLHGQYLRLKPEIDEAMQSVIDSSAFINGPQVKEFAGQLASYLQVPYVVPCGNGTDALQIALMALGLKPGDEVIVPSFTYIAAVEAVVMLGLTPVLVDVDSLTFNIDETLIEKVISSKTKAIIAVHLFGQCCHMETILQIASDHQLYVIEDNAQSMGAICTFTDGTQYYAGTMGHIGTTSFFPSKPLACYGDGGAMITSDPELAERLYKMANHGQAGKYNHEMVGCNSRLDTLQAAILQVKLRHLDDFNRRRQQIAKRYDEELSVVEEEAEAILLPIVSDYSTHVYHQYTLQVLGDETRDKLKEYLAERHIPSMVYYPLPVYKQHAYKKLVCFADKKRRDESGYLAKDVLSIPIHTEMKEDEQAYIIEAIKAFYGM
ncbi:UDP-2-acetamido-2-deoxy-ribo-hexuluronate aminotransferase [Parabacteroides sp. PFB2-10]|uniref:DegT/DnrJ/EryC1/StrS family aminotransferase n=1 Tax=Parabacteroides sp. PFB2-10 TaxID=1742405 RepID=UPI002474720B|nr:DegT/DnrJ/EryC1/StrS family aminotransferase [Parabacteroides sp. PFB2-10]MDH6314237.1 UDP-2-acetamido-2-deoxy-ribo-hexuluronate aminotransferase [Parabacteroides sp. PFB2-10]MDL2244634.1 DegT/DnrJ/EryC1/StrS family aminotransferase [Parabacteroides sp. OttesenSCG-928-J18]